MLPVYLAAGLVYLLFIPEQLHVRIGGLYFPPYRFLLIPAALYLFAGGLRGHLKFVWPDYFVIFAAAWIWLASYMTSGSLASGAIQGGAHTVDIALAYFLARLTIQTPRDLRIFLILIAPGVALMGALVMQESVTHVRFLQPLASELTGAPNPLRDDIRLGLMRGAAAFPHPILAGIFLASFLPLYLMAGLRGWPKIVGILAALGGAFSMSSAALLGLLVGGLLYLYDWTTMRIGNFNWRLFLFLAAVTYLTVELLSNSSFYDLLIRYASLNNASAYNRVLIWQYGTENIARNPWFGIGYADWDRPSWMHSDSFDHFWLIMALRFGMPASFSLIVVTLAGVILLAIRSQKLPPLDAQLYRGVSISLAVFALGVISVSLWLSALVWFCMLLGIAVSLGASSDNCSDEAIRQT